MRERGAARCGDFSIGLLGLPLAFAAYHRAVVAKGHDVDLPLLPARVVGAPPPTDIKDKGNLAVPRERDEPLAAHLFEHRTRERGEVVCGNQACHFLGAPGLNRREVAGTKRYQKRNRLSFST